MTEKRDLIVLGSGPGGYVAALRAAHLGLRVTVVERDPLPGGTCLHRGCIPTKALLHTAETLETIRDAARFGVEVAAATLDLEATRSYKEKVVNTNARGVAHLLKAAGIETVTGTGRLGGPGVIVVAGEEGEVRLETERVLLATGSTPQHLALAPVDGVRILDSDSLLELKRIPTSIAILGAGAVGVEFACILQSFGSEVTLIEMLPRVLPNEDEEVSKALEKALRKKGIRVLVDTRAEAVTAPAGGELADQRVQIRLDQDGSQASISVDSLLVAVGRRPCTDSIGLDTVGIETDRGFVPVDGRMRTAVEGIWAIGDLVATPQLAHVASAEGIVAAEDMAGLEPTAIDYNLVPSCTYSEPQVASIGLTEAAARQRNEAVEVGRFNFAASGKAAILGRREGFVKIIRSVPHDEILGVHIIGPQATELIAEAGVAMRLESTTEELFRTMHAHPTLSEAVMEAARSASGAAIHG